jgi:hypothetical protein
LTTAPQDCADLSTLDALCTLGDPEGMFPFCLVDPTTLADCLTGGDMGPDTDVCTAIIAGASDTLLGLPDIVTGFLCDSGVLDDTALSMLCGSGPEPEFAASANGPYSGTTGAAITINATADNAVGTWDCSWASNGTGYTFGDDGDCNTTVTYSAPGVYNLTVTITDGTNTGQDSTDVTVTDPTPPPSGCPAPSGPNAALSTALGALATVSEQAGLGEGSGTACYHAEFAFEHATVSDAQLVVDGSGDFVNVQVHLFDQAGAARAFDNGTDNVPQLVVNGVDAALLNASDNGPAVKLFYHDATYAAGSNSATFSIPTSDLQDSLVYEIHVESYNSSRDLDDGSSFPFDFAYYSLPASAVFAAGNAGLADQLDAVWTPIVVDPLGIAGTVDPSLVTDLVDLVISLIPDPTTIVDPSTIEQILQDALDTVTGTASDAGAGILSTLGTAVPPLAQTVTVTATDASASESGDAGQYTFVRTADPGKLESQSELAVDYVMSGASNGIDYQALSGTVTFAAGETSKTLALLPILDHATEGNENAVLTLADSSADPGSPTYVVGGSPATIAITDLPTISIAATDGNAGEPSDAGQFTLTRSGDSAPALTVGLVRSGTASSDDVQALPATVSFAAGQTSATIDVSPIDDFAVEGTETVVLALADGDA